MNEPIIDEEYLLLVKDKIDELISELECYKKIMINKEDTIFDRYMAFLHLDSIMHIVFNARYLRKHLLVSGFYLNHELLATQQAKNNGWDFEEIQNHPFFTTQENLDSSKKTEDGLKKLKERVESLISKDTTH